MATAKAEHTNMLQTPGGPTTTRQSIGLGVALPVNMKKHIVATPARPHSQTVQRRGRS